MVKTISELKAQSAEVKNASAIGENTATRVGQLFGDIVEHVEQYENTKDGKDASQDAQMQSLVSAEESRAKGEERGLQNQIHAEKIDRQTADTYLGNLIQQEISTRAEADENIRTALANETARAQAAEQELVAAQIYTAKIKDGAVTTPKIADGAVTYEKTDIIAQELGTNMTKVPSQKVVTDAIQKEETERKADIDGLTVALGSETIHREQADKAEESRAKGEERGLQNQIHAEEIDRKTADTYLANLIQQETERATEAENNLQEQITSEAEARNLAINNESQARSQNDQLLSQAIAAEQERAEAAEQANATEINAVVAKNEKQDQKLSELENKTEDISNDVVETEDESIAIEDNNGNMLAKITPDSSSFKNLKNNGKDVLTEHQDISNLATKEDLDGIEHESVVEEEEGVVFEEEDGNFCARVNHRGVDSVGYALNGNPITKTHEPSNQCKGLTHYYHEGGDTIQYTYDFTDDSYIIHNPNGVNGNIYAEIVGLKTGKTYRISGIGSGITSTKRICASNVVAGLNNTIAELEDNGEGIYSAEFTVLENTITTINIAPRYNSKLTSFTNIKVIEVSDVERSVLVNDFIDNISLEELSDDLKKQLSIDENPTTYCGRSACVFNNVLFIGDSLTEGAFNKKGTNGMSDASGSFYRQEYSYPYFFKKLTGANGENWGLGGHTTKGWWDVRTTEGHPSYKPDDQWKGFDCAIIALGTNDAFRSSSASDTTTALNNIINKVLTLNPRISVFVATPFGGHFALDSKFTEVSETIRGVVDGRTDCYLLDINRYGHMNEKRGYNAGHFTAIGYERLAEDIINYMSWIIDSNDWDFRHVQFSNTNYEPFN